MDMKLSLDSDKDIDIPTADFKDDTSAYVGLNNRSFTSDFERKTLGEKGYTSTASQIYQSPSSQIYQSTDNQNNTGILRLTGQNWTVGTGGGSKEFAPDALSAFLVRNTNEIILGMTPRGHNMVYVRRGICRIGSSIRDVAGKPVALVGRTYPLLLRVIPTILTV